MSECRFAAGGRGGRRRGLWRGVGDCPENVHGQDALTGGDVPFTDRLVAGTGDLDYQLTFKGNRLEGSSPRHCPRNTAT